MGHDARQRLIRPSLGIQRLFGWFDRTGSAIAKGMDIITHDFVPMSIRLEDAIIGRGQSEVFFAACTCWRCRTGGVS